MFNRKHRFSFFKSPKYQESFDFHGDKKTFIALTLKVTRKLGWSKTYSEANTLIFRSNEKWSSNAKITIQFESLTNISIQSETIVDQRWDLGKNFTRIRDFKNLIFDYWNSLTEIDKRNIQDTEESLLGYFDYKLPHNFKSVLEKTTTNNSYLSIYCGLLTLILGIVFGYLEYLDLFVVSTREMIFSVSLWFAIYFGAKHGNIHSYKRLKRVAFVALFFFYGCQVFIHYSLVFFTSPDSIDLIEYIGHQLSISSNGFLDRIGQKIIVIVLIAGLIGYFFFLNLKLSISKLKKKEIPDEVLTYAEYLIAKGESNYQIKNNLTKKGITDYQLHNQILEVLSYKEEILS
ncbi:MAG: hypothetical protein BalsKO_19780 [Balneolaceae bacterium]